MKKEKKQLTKQQKQQLELKMYGGFAVFFIMLWTLILAM